MIYAWRVSPPGGGQAAGVLCLVFRFANECERIFHNLRSGDDWSVITLLDTDGRVMSSSDPWQVPVGAPMEACDDSPCRTASGAAREPRRRCVPRPEREETGVARCGRLRQC